MPADDRHEPGRRVEDETTIDADPGDAYRAWADPVEIARWFVERATGKAEPKGTMVWAWDAYNSRHELKVLEAEEGRRLVLRTQWGGHPLTVIEVVLEPLPQGTRVRLVHSGFGEGDDWDAEYEGTRSGWNNALAHLKHYLEQYRGRDKLTLDLMEDVAYPVEDLVTATRTAGGLAKWLGDAEGDLSDPESPIRIDLAGGERLTGRVLTSTDWQAAVTWEEVEGILTFQGFPGDVAGKGQRVGLHVFSWAEDPDRVTALQGDLEEALARLVKVLERARPPGEGFRPAFPFHAG